MVLLTEELLVIDGFWGKKIVFLWECGGYWWVVRGPVDGPIANRQRQLDSVIILKKRRRRGGGEGGERQGEEEEGEKEVIAPADD